MSVAAWAGPPWGVSTFNGAARGPGGRADPITVSRSGGRSHPVTFKSGAAVVSGPRCRPSPPLQRGLRRARNTHAAAVKNPAVPIQISDNVMLHPFTIDRPAPAHHA